MLSKYLHILALSNVAIAAPQPFLRRDSSIPPVTHTATATTDVSAAAATALTESSTSHVKGKAFDRILTVYLETTAYENAIADPDCQALIEKGILHTNTYGVGSPSQPNYIAPGSGDTFGLNSDSFVLVDKNVSTVVDLLENKAISWGDYNEGLPYTGFEGFAYSNPVEGNYERKHNLLARFESIRLNSHRISRVKNLTLFYQDLQNEVLPQWAFVTPNLYNDGHDTNISVSCNWTRNFVEPLLNNTYFNKNALIYITWQANGQEPTARNHVAGILLGSAIPTDLIGTTDDAYYNHYSDISTVEANWNLHHLGRWDVGANVWDVVGRHTGDKIRQWNSKIANGSFESYYWNQSYGGVFSSAVNTTHTYVAPNLDLVRNGRTILPAIKDVWGKSCGTKGGRKHNHHHDDEDRDGDEDYKKHEKIENYDSWEYENHESYQKWDIYEDDNDDNNDDNYVEYDAGDEDYGYDEEKRDEDGHREGPRKKKHGHCLLPSYYRDIIELPDNFHPPKGFEVPIPLAPPPPITTPITAYPYSEETTIPASPRR